ncbi:hypothetical protein Ga0123461_1112 [Mariprofundus aestuarium]|uniref:Uncharacterized protein n=1 Tax=Mariprofundus aestuarium TaxID=1921086 RepID=A0A2K8L147_MARES|nr:hypothetical protein Ga0123461_1112 [Mariprofundus aestuarium]
MVLEQHDIVQINYNKDYLRCHLFSAILWTVKSIIGSGYYECFSAIPMILFTAMAWTQKSRLKVVTNPLFPVGDKKK